MAILVDGSIGLHPTSVLIGGRLGLDGVVKDSFSRNRSLRQTFGNLLAFLVKRLKTFANNGAF